MPLGTFIVVVVHVVIYDGFDLRILRSVFQFILNILHMAKEAFLWCIIPAAAPAGHGLPKLFVSDDLDETAACVMAALIRMCQTKVPVTPKTNDN